MSAPRGSAAELAAYRKLQDALLPTVRGAREPSPPTTVKGEKIFKLVLSPDALKALASGRTVEVKSQALGGRLELKPFAPLQCGACKAPASAAEVANGGAS